MPEVTDAQLIEQVKKGDAKAMDSLLARHEQKIYRFGLRMCGNEDDARDVLQETLLAAFKNLGTFRGDSQLSTWLYQVARSFCIKQRRRREGEPAHLESMEGTEVKAIPTDSTSLDAKAHAREVGHVIQAAMNTLQEEHREALVLRDVEGLSAEEAADVVGIEVGALKSRLHRARMQLKQSLAAVLDDRDTDLGCPELQQELSAYAASEIDQAACARIEAHLEGCVRCTAACDSLKRTVSMCRAIPGGEVPAPVRAAVRQALRMSAE
ncbi:MAG: sigma-70 family RNA polymerase sigma factor [Archangium sp.]|nr:sigma-70 family RNA polymerase sigma factor [Archangium sp.]